MAGILSGLDVETFEYDCGSPCTTDGCPGHATDIPISFEVGGVRFIVDGYEGGSFPGTDKDEIDLVVKVMAELEKAIDIHEGVKP